MKLIEVDSKATLVQFLRKCNEKISGNKYKYKYFYFPIKEPFRAEQLTKNLIQWLWIDYIDWNMTTYMYYETNKSKFNHTIDIVIVAFEWACAPTKM